MCVCLYVDRFKVFHVCVCACVCVCMCVQVYCTWVYAHVCAHNSIYVTMYASMYVYACDEYGVQAIYITNASHRCVHSFTCML